MPTSALAALQYHSVRQTTVGDAAKRTARLRPYPVDGYSPPSVRKQTAQEWRRQRARDQWYAALPAALRACAALLTMVAIVCMGVLVGLMTAALPPAAQALAQLYSSVLLGVLGFSVITTLGLILALRHCLRQIAYRSL